MTITAQRGGWASIKNGKLLALAAGELDVLLTADKGMEYQQHKETLPMAMPVGPARSNRVERMSEAVPAILSTLGEFLRRTLRKVVA